MELGADDDLLEFKTLYCSALKGTSSYSPNIEDQVPGMDPIFDTILEEIPEPDIDVEGPLQFQPALLDYNDYVGRIGIGRIKSGTIRVNETVACVRLDGSVKNFKIQKLYGYFGLKKIEIEEASAGNIVAIAGLSDLSVGETICNPSAILPLPKLRIDEPTLQMTFGVNSSPFAGQDGKLLTYSKIEERLFKECQRDVSLRVEKIPNTESFIVSGRGELHLSILIENMRREGFELQVSKPEVILKEIDGEICEPFEDVQIDCPEEYLGNIMDTFGTRGGELIHMSYSENQVRVNYVVPSRALLGFATQFLTMTKGYGIINHSYKEYRPRLNMKVGERKVGVLVSTENGQATPYAITHVEERGILFIAPGTQVYEGMIVGENKYDMDLAVTVVKEKNLTNMRSASKDTTVVLKTPRKMSLEECLDYINTDELVEVTPLTYRLRKKILDTVERKKFDSRNKKEQAQ